MQKPGTISDQSTIGGKILIVDDQEANIRLLGGILKKASYQIVSTTDSRQVASLLAQFQPDLILLDLTMPYMDGFQVLTQLKSLIPESDYLPILVLTADVTREARRLALSMGAKDFLTKPFDPMEVMLRIQNLLATRFLHHQLQNQNQVLEEKVRERTLDLEKAQVEILERLAVAAEYRDDDTGQHTRRVGHLSGLLAAALGLPDDYVELIQRAATMHDLGKIGIPDDILLKRGTLTPEEFDVMKTHTLMGAGILSGGYSELIRMAELIATTHHERWDGSGYPQGLEGEAIPIAGRIVALADAFDALTHKRPYKKPWTVKEAVAEVQRQAGKQFDPKIVKAFSGLQATKGKP
jgi:putative two-component system response regulator